jgi:hypothetical protein
MCADTTVQFNVEYLYHMTHITNIPSILKYGLLSHREAYDRGLNKVTIANPKVIAIRSRKLDGIFQRPLVDYVCLYFNPKNPMLFVQYRENLQNDIVILGIRANLLYRRNTVFTDGNAAVYETLFYSKPEYLDCLHWEAINATYWSEFNEGKRKSCAEVLHYRSVSVDDIPIIFCGNKDTYLKANEATAYFNDVRAIYKPSLFF